MYPSYNQPQSLALKRVIEKGNQVRRRRHRYSEITLT